MFQKLETPVLFPNGFLTDLELNSFKNSGFQLLNVFDDIYVSDNALGHPGRIKSRSKKEKIWRFEPKFWVEFLENLKMNKCAIFLGYM